MNCLFIPLSVIQSHHDPLVLWIITHDARLYGWNDND